VTAPLAIIAHRCVEHADYAPLNGDAVAMVHYPHEGPTSIRPMDTFRGECGACLGEQVEVIWQEYLNMLDVVADCLRAHAELRRKHEAKLIVHPGGR
jgi:hypothetical protein